MMLKDPDAGVRYYRTGSAASAMGPDILDGVPVADARAVLVTGVTALIGVGPHAAGLALLAARARSPDRRSKSSCGLVGIRSPPRTGAPFVERCDLLLAGDAELAEIAGCRTGGGAAGDAGSRAELARLASALGPREVVVRSAASIGVLAGGSWTTIDIRRDAAVDPIGAGDAFNAGYIAVRLRGGTIEDALRSGARCGAAVTTSLSDTAGFPKDSRLRSVQGSGFRVQGSFWQVLGSGSGFTANPAP